MKRLTTLLLLLFSLVASSQTVSMIGIGDVKVGMKQADLEKLTGIKVKLKHLAKKESDSYRDSVNFTYKEVEYMVTVERSYSEENNNDITVAEVRSSSPKIKTKSGIGIGDDKYKIISTYEGYTIHIMPEWEDNYTKKSKTKSTVWLHGDETGNVIIFYLDNNKVTAIAVTYNEGC
jgi:predicted solute-binding protein